MPSLHGQAYGWNRAYAFRCACAGIEAFVLDLFYITVAAAFFAGCWYLVKACEKL